jgi:excisionase family DNA binding protein
VRYDTVEHLGITIGIPVNEYLNLVEATRYLGVSRMTLYKLIREGKLPTYRSELNRAVRLVRCGDLYRLLIRRTT